MAPSDPSPRVRWTEHGPVPVEKPDEPTPTPVVAAAPPALEEPVAPLDEATRPLEAPRPDAPVPAEDPEPPAGEDVGAVRRRLAERGLLRQEPSVRIRDVTEAPAPREPDVTFAPEPLTTPVTDDPADAAGLDRERVGPGADVRCPTCRTSQHVADDASGFVCMSCSSVWRWAICSNCAEVSLAFARQQSWRCGGCTTSTRSWWRTPVAARENQLLRERRREDAAAARRARAYEIARRRRWKVLSAGIAVILVTAAAAAVVSRRSSDDAARGAAGRACDAFSSSNLATGANPAEVRADLDALAAIADDAPDEIRLPAQRLAASGRPGDPTFESTRAQLQTACRSSESGS